MARPKLEIEKQVERQDKAIRKLVSILTESTLITFNENDKKKIEDILDGKDETTE